MSSLRFAVIGGGAAGYFGAIACASANPGSEVHLYESTSHCLKKVKISGGGRCNVTHHCFDPAQLVKNYPRGSRELRGPFNRFQPSDTVKWFESRGVELKVEEDGRMFPITDDSATIVQCLVREADRVGVRVFFESSVQSIEKKENQFRIVLKDAPSPENYHAVLMATGSSPQGYRLAESLGHQIVPTVPSLFTFNVRDPRLDGLAGVSFSQVQLELKFKSGAAALKQLGPLLITHWGLSGPAVLKLSAFGARPLCEADYHAELLIQFLPGSSSESVFDRLKKYKEANGKKQLGTYSPLSEVPRRYWERLVQVHEVPPTKIWAEISDKKMRHLSDELTRGKFQIEGKGVFKEEFVTCGGVELKEIDFKTMESKVCAGLYFAGEVLDIDGITGGFNFQNAWTTSFIAGNSMGRRVSGA